MVTPQRLAAYATTGDNLPGKIGTSTQTPNSNSGGSAPSTYLLNSLLQESRARHHKLYPQQILGVRLDLRILLDQGFVDSKYQSRFQNNDKRLLTIIETEGCWSDGIAAVTDTSGKLPELFVIGSAKK